MIDSTVLIQAAAAATVAPKIAQGAMDLAKVLFGPYVNEVGQWLADPMRARRQYNFLQTMGKANDLLAKQGLEVREIDFKTMSIIVEQVSTEEDEELRNRWVNLIANVATDPDESFKPKLVQTMSRLSAIEARVLDYVKEQHDLNMEKVLQSRVIDREMINKAFDDNYEIVNICLDGLISLALVAEVEPELHGLSSGEPYLTSSYDVYLSSYGEYFLSKLIPPSVPDQMGK